MQRDVFYKKKKFGLASCVFLMSCITFFGTCRSVQ